MTLSSINTFCQISDDRAVYTTESYFSIRSVTFISRGGLRLYMYINFYTSHALARAERIGRSVLSIH